MAHMRTSGDWDSDTNGWSGGGHGSDDDTGDRNSQHSPHLRPSFGRPNVFFPANGEDGIDAGSVSAGANLELDGSQGQGGSLIHYNDNRERGLSYDGELHQSPSFNAGTAEPSPDNALTLSNPPITYPLTRMRVESEDMLIPPSPRLSFTGDGEAYMQVSGPDDPLELSMGSEDGAFIHYAISVSIYTYTHFCQYMIFHSYIYLTFCVFVY